MVDVDRRALTTNFFQIAVRVFESHPIYGMREDQIDTSMASLSLFTTTL
ncbi:hypothetical protein [Bordetella genomosp. 1]|nr:hypothetical protein [Bordetella genomosp. 1]